MSALSRGLKDPALILNTCLFCEPSERVRLLCVSRPFFKAAVSFVWREVEGVEHLLALIPNVTCVTIEEENMAKKISFPRDKLDFQRFNVYAPFIKILEIYDRDTEKYLLPKWWRFMSHARSKTLLPNLSHLTLETQSPLSDQLMWIRTFLSPSLVRITVIPFTAYTPLISYLEASGLLKHITTVCSRLQELSLFPESEDLNGYRKGPRDSRKMLNFWDCSLPQHLAQLQSLRKLTTTTEVLAPEALNHLTTLPNLESLVVYLNQLPFKANGPFKPKKSTAGVPFQALRDFELCSAPHFLFAEIWQLQCFRHLTSLQLTFINMPEDQESWRSSLFSLICDSNPGLTKLIINFERDRVYEYLMDIGEISDLRLMEKLPLNHLGFMWVCLGSLDQVDPSIYSILPIVWSQLTVLDLPEVLGTPSRLFWFSKLLHLRRLVLDVMLATPSLDDMPSPGPKNLCFCILESSTPVNIIGDIHQIAHWLISLWPTLEKVDWCKAEASQLILDTVAGSLNSTIKLLHELNQMKARLSLEPYGPQALVLFPNDL